MEDNTFAFSDMVGEHILTGIEFGNREKEDWGRVEIISTVSVTLDGITYTAYEDEDDGYRSYCCELERTDVPVAPFTGGNPDGYAVIVTFLDEWRWELASRPVQADLIEIRMKSTGDLILRLGTENTDDYYPCAICEYVPESLGLVDSAGS